MLETSARTIPIQESDDAAARTGRTAASSASGDAERDLVERARTDRAAFAELYRLHVERIYGFAYRRSGSTQVAEDITSATFERALRSMNTFEWRAGGFGAWLYRIASNELASHYRRVGRARSDKAQRAYGMYIAGVAGVDHERVDHLGSATEIRAAMQALPARYQEALTLRYLSGLSHADSAQAMGVSKPVMAVTVHRAVAALRRAMDNNKKGGPDDHYR